MASITNIAPGMVKTWSKQSFKDNRLLSCWDEFSNLANGLASAPNAKENRVPKEMLHYVEAGDGKGWETTIPMVLGLRQDGVGGLQQAEGKGESVAALYATVHWNVARKVINVSAKGVEAASIEYMRNVKDSHGKLSDWHAEDKDYRCQQALIEGGDRYITNSDYWKDYAEMKTAPHEKRLHPNIAFKGMTSEIARVADFNSDVAALKTVLGNQLSPDSKFTLAALNGAIDYVYKFITPLKMAAGNNAVLYVMLVSPYQALELARDAEWKSLMTNAEKRGPDNRAISGILGTYRGVLMIEDQRSPIFNLTSGAFEYVTPMEAAKVDGFYGHGRLNRSAKAAQGTSAGSVEIARILGAGALGCPKKGTLEFTDDGKGKDFGFQKEICATIECGYNRLDFKGKDVYDNNKEVIRNTSSALYFTSTPTISY